MPRSTGRSEEDADSADADEAQSVFLSDRFITTIGETRVLPEALETTYEKLREALTAG